MSFWDGFQGANLGYALELYERFLQDPNSVDAETRSAFEKHPPTDVAAPIAGSPAPERIDKVVAAVNYAESIRKFGHMDAQIDPLGSLPPSDPTLHAQFHGITEEELRHFPAGIIVGPIARGKESALDVIRGLKSVYCSSIGYDYAHLRDPEERHWLYEAVETGRFRPPADPIDAVALLARLTQIETFEQFLHRAFPGKTRFSVEGLDMLIPILDEVLASAGEAGMRNVLIGMAHRARLNVLAHILKKPYRQILAEFKDAVSSPNFGNNLGWTGDVKYHLGASRAIHEGRQVELIVSMPPNPSHLESVDPVAEGMARAAGTSIREPGPPQFDPTLTLPVLIHGDASFAGQGVVAETLNLYRLPGYTTGGTVHIITNNQLGYTTNPTEFRSAPYASDLARGFRIPIVHVNADNPAACIEVSRLAFAYRARFHKDFVIDLVGYRRHGHNEGDEPSFTQPLIYEKIQNHPTVREIWAESLARSGAVEKEASERIVRDRLSDLEEVLKSLDSGVRITITPPEAPPPGAARATKTAVPIGKLRKLNENLLSLPQDFSIHRKLLRARERRAQALEHLDEKTIDWATAEELALASILADGTSIRMTGEDVERGTFSQRHAVFHDFKTGARFCPLQNFQEAKTAFEIHNSPLTEAATLAFEYGYSLQEPSRMVIWEAQYGDFINGAQTVLDEFVTSARAKWGLTPSLVLLLPHGFEGQGPDHSSARPERFLQAAAEINLRIANCTTAGQYFHLLRRQAALLRVDPLPLVVLTPKSLLRNPIVFSSPRELAEGSWQRVIDDAEATARAPEIRRLLLCSGKVYVDLVTSALRETNRDVAICRIEQSYPFPEADLERVFDGYSNLQEIIWVQEEPENMGAWEYARPLLAKLMGNRWSLRYVGRNRSSSPAEGSLARHVHNQRAIVEQAFSSRLEATAEDMVLVKKS